MNNNMNAHNLSLKCFVNITLNKYIEKNIIWLEKLLYVYILGPFLFLGIAGNIFYFIYTFKIKYYNKDGSVPVNTNDNHPDNKGDIMSKNSNKIRINSNKMSPSTYHQSKS
ncbi:unnamed protein product [Gordionus sp. m RMFG-2023]